MTVHTLHAQEEHRVTGRKLVARVTELVREGSVRRLIIKNADGVVLIEVPLTVGLVGAVLQPMLVAVGALAALAAHYRIAVERDDTAAPVGTGTEAERCFHGRTEV